MYYTNAISKEIANNDFIEIANNDFIEMIRRNRKPG